MNDSSAPLLIRIEDKPSFNYLDNALRSALYREIKSPTDDVKCGDMKQVANSNKLPEMEATYAAFLIVSTLVNEDESLQGTPYYITKKQLDNLSKKVKHHRLELRNYYKNINLAALRGESVEGKPVEITGNLLAEAYVQQFEEAVMEWARKHDDRAMALHEEASKAAGRG